MGQAGNKSIRFFGWWAFKYDTVHGYTSRTPHKLIAADSGSIPKGQRWFLLNKLFGLRPSEIAEMEGMDKRNSSVRQLIIRVSDQLKAGEISLIETTSKEAQAAKARLDAHNAKRRERHTRKMQSH